MCAYFPRGGRRSQAQKHRDPMCYQYCHCCCTMYCCCTYTDSTTTYPLHRTAQMRIEMIDEVTILGSSVKYEYVRTHILGTEIKIKHLQV